MLGLTSLRLAGDSLAILRAELKSQKKHVRSLKKKSLWSKILEEVATNMPQGNILMINATKNLLLSLCVLCVYAKTSLWFPACKC